MRIELNELQKTIERAEIPKDWKVILSETMNSIAKQSENVLSEIRSRVLREEDSINLEWAKKWNILTELVSTNELVGFQNIISNQKDKIDDENFLGEPSFVEVTGNYFLDCSYDDTIALCSDEYGDDYPYTGSIDMQGENITFRYRLAHDLSYVIAEKILYDVADIYQIKRPIIFSPYSRRAVKIQIPKEYSNVVDLLKANDVDLTPYCLEDNKLAGKLTFNKRLMWNVRIESVPLPQYSVFDDNDNSSFAPYGDCNIYRYEFKNLKENEFICPSADDVTNIITAQITPQNDDDRRHMITLIAKKQITSRCISLRIIQTQNNSGIQNEGMIFKKERLRTRGDIENVLYQLCMPQRGFKCSLLAVSDTEKKNIEIIHLYNRELAYGLPNNQREQLFYLSRRKLPFCYLTFEGDSKFLNDYASYVISFLENYYPDFQWVGVK